eukprot:TRINITY_DN29730_c0_g1_i1.p1 TRINITY_DN29730_c0_g1~~TRINITY_DN29730_c0_g1_i1.p1  ORF type:complete len:322 (+),score=50.22 TRINITY_DN29730_c0_g1_i1:143-1108(+)
MPSIFCAGCSTPRAAPDIGVERCDSRAWTGLGDLTAAASKLRRSQAWQRALLLLPLATSRALRPDTVFGNAVEAAVARGGWRRAVQHLRDLRRLSLQLDCVSLSSWFAEETTQRPWSMMLSVLHVAGHGGIKLDAIAVAAAMTSCETRSWTWSMRLLVVMAEVYGGEIFLSCVHSAMVSCQRLVSAAGAWSRAAALGACVKQCSLRPNMVTQSIVASLSGSSMTSSSWQRLAACVWVPSRLQRALLEVDVVACSAAVGAHARKWECVYELLNAYAERGLGRCVRDVKALLVEAVAAFAGSKFLNCTGRRLWIAVRLEEQVL